MVSAAEVAQIEGAEHLPFWKVKILFRQLLDNAAPSEVEQAIDCLHALVNSVQVRMADLGGNDEARQHMGAAWVHLYDAGKAVAS